MPDGSMSLPREWREQKGSISRGRIFPHENSLDENMNERLGSQFSIHSAPVLDKGGDLSERSSSIWSLKRPASEVLPPQEDDDDVFSSFCFDDDDDNQLTVTSIKPLLALGKDHLVVNLTAQFPKNDHKRTASVRSDSGTPDEDENLLTISSLTARPLIAKSEELRKKKIAKKLREAERNARISRFRPPDGGYGWWVVVGAFLVQFWVAGLVKSYGVLFVEIMEAFSDSSASMASWIPAILSTLCLALAPLTSALCQKFTCRTVVFVGGVFCAVGLILSYFATSLIHLFVTFGVLTGIGGGLSTTPGIIIVSRYFDKHRAFANGICVSGTAAGSFVFPMLIDFLVETYGFHGTILILGGCMLHVCVSAALYRPLVVHQRLVELKEGKNDSDFRHENNVLKDVDGLVGVKISCSPEDMKMAGGASKLQFLFINEPIKTTPNADGSNANNLTAIFEKRSSISDASHELTDSEEEKDKIGDMIQQIKPIIFRSSSILHSVEDLSTDSTCVYKDKKMEEAILQSLQTAIPELNCEKKKTMSEKIKKYLDLSLLKDVHFLFMSVSVMLMSAGCPYVLYYVPAYATSTGYTKTEAGYLVSISAVLDLVGRLGLGWLSDLKLFERRKGYIGSILGAAVSVLFLPLADSFYVLAVLVGIYGLCLGSWFLLVPVLLADQHGTEKISSSYGLVRLFQSFGAITVPPFSGFLKDVTGGYQYCFYFMGTCMLMGGVVMLVQPIVARCTRIQSETDSKAKSEVP